MFNVSFKPVAYTPSDFLEAISRPEADLDLRSVNKVEKEATQSDLDRLKVDPSMMKVSKLVDFEVGIVPKPILGWREWLALKILPESFVNNNLTQDNKELAENLAAMVKRYATSLIAQIVKNPKVMDVRLTTGNLAKLCQKLTGSTPDALADPKTVATRAKFQEAIDTLNKAKAAVDEKTADAKQKALAAARKEAQEAFEADVQDAATTPGALKGEKQVDQDTFYKQLSRRPWFRGQNFRVVESADLTFETYVSTKPLFGKSETTMARRIANAETISRKIVARQSYIQARRFNAPVMAEKLVGMKQEYTAGKIAPAHKQRIERAFDRAIAVLNNAGVAIANDVHNDPSRKVGRVLKNYVAPAVMRVAVDAPAYLAVEAPYQYIVKPAFQYIAKPIVTTGVRLFVDAPIVETAYQGGRWAVVGAAKLTKYSIGKGVNMGKGAINYFLRSNNMKEIK